VGARVDGDDGRADGARVAGSGPLVGAGHHGRERVDGGICGEGERGGQRGGGEREQGNETATHGELSSWVDDGRELTDSHTRPRPLRSRRAIGRGSPRSAGSARVPPYLPDHGRRGG